MIASALFVIAVFSGLLVWRISNAHISDQLATVGEQLQKTLKTELVVQCLATSVLYLLIWSSVNFRMAFALLVGSACVGLGRYVGVTRLAIDSDSDDMAEDASRLLRRFQMAVFPPYLIGAICLASLSIAFLWFDSAGFTDTLTGFALGACFAGVLPSLTFGDLGGAYPELVNAISATLVGVAAVAKIASIMPIADPTERGWFVILPLVIWGVGCVSYVLSAKSMTYLVESMPQEALRNSSLFAVVVMCTVLFGYAVFFPGLTLWYWVSILIGATLPVLFGLAVEFILDGEHGRRFRLATVIGVGFLLLALMLLVSNWAGGIEGGLFSMALAGLGGCAISALYAALSLTSLISSKNLYLHPTVADEYLEFETSASAFVSGALSGVSLLALLSLFAVVAEVLVVSARVPDLTLMNSHVLLGLCLGISISAFWLKMLSADKDATEAELRMAIIYRSLMVLSPVAIWLIFDPETLVGVLLSMAFAQLFGFYLKGAWSLVSFSLFSGILALVLI